jgi:hypothetical protein
MKLLEMEAWMVRVLTEQSVCFPSLALDMGW